MKHDLSMSYRRILKISPKQNSINNLVLRQQFAIKYLELMKNSKLRIINMDESHFSETDFRYMKWRIKGTTNSIPSKSVAPRISMIVALDNWGRVYFSCTQVNTDSKIMKLYFQELVKVLDKEDQDWRKNSFILADGAKYHQSPATFDALRKMRIPLMLIAPHGYNVAPIELLFSAIKRTNLNPQQLPTGREHFLNVVRMIVTRLQ